MQRARREIGLTRTQILGTPMASGAAETDLVRRRVALAFFGSAFLKSPTTGHKSPVGYWSGTAALSAWLTIINYNRLSFQLVEREVVLKELII